MSLSVRGRFPAHQYCLSVVIPVKTDFMTHEELLYKVRCS